MFLIFSKSNMLFLFSWVLLVLIIWLWHSSSLFFSLKFFVFAFFLSSFLSSRLILFLLLSKLVLKTSIVFPLIFAIASSLSRITCFLYSLSYYSIWLSNSAWVLKDISALSWQLVFILLLVASLRTWFSCPFPLAIAIQTFSISL